ncbi:response regulator transcription factor [Candidatus Solirubrobacter pratensis]|uniref:response regulator transcription factor n=1 Tax=Candidatus Solirubrobacter pratensis TaxID=1298857 RepID=UPI00047FDEF9|nr:response regulator transcription factor [Candidatus Solirubrobacter pratensis]
MRVLVVEDDDRVAGALCDLLGRHGFAMMRAAGVTQALAQLDDSVDIVLLDLMLPDGDGFDLCARIRGARNVPILMTTARSELRWRIHGLHLGADDYLVKPYDARELIARMLAVHRRMRAAAPPAPPSAGRVVRVGGVRIDLGRREVTVAGDRVPLTRKELALLEVLAEHPGIVVRRERLLSRVWSSAYEFDAHTLDVHVAAVRAKTGMRGLIETVRGVGYRLGDG